jgi:hypothetical protein
MQQHPSTIACTAEGLFIWPGVPIAVRGWRRPCSEIVDLLACL